MTNVRNELFWDYLFKTLQILFLNIPFTKKSFKDCGRDLNNNKSIVFFFFFNSQSTFLKLRRSFVKKNASVYSDINA
jgi:hypothetical protein